MRKQDYLTELIHSLSPNEQRYFKLYTNLQPGPKVYLKLFDILEGVDVYDTRVISKQLGITTKQLADVKEYLQRVLLRSLSNYELDSRPQAMMMQQYLEADLLNRRGYKQYALSHLDKMYEKTIEYEQFGLFAHYYRLRKILVRDDVDPSPGLVSPGLFRQQMRALDEVLKLQELYDEMMVIAVNRQNIEKLSAIKKRPPLNKKPEQLLSVEAKVIWYETQNTIQAITGNLGPKATYYASGMITLFEKHPFLQQTRSVTYVSSYLRLALSMPYTEGEKAIKTLDKALAILYDKKSGIHSPMKERMQFEITVQRMNMLNGLFRYDETIKAAREILDIKLQQANEHKRIILLYLYAAALLFSGKSQQALAPLKEMATFKRHRRLDILLLGMEIELMVQFDMGNYSLIPHSVLAIRRFTKRKGLDPSESAEYLKWMLRLCKSNSTPNIKKEIKAFIQAINTGQVQMDMGYMNIKYWLQQKLENLD